MRRAGHGQACYTPRSSLRTPSASLCIRPQALEPIRRDERGKEFMLEHLAIRGLIAQLVREMT